VIFEGYNMTDEKMHHETKLESDIEQLENHIEHENEVLEELIDLEEWVKAQKKPCKAKHYRIRIDKDKFTVHVHEMTGKEILNLVHKTPENTLLYEKFRHGERKIINPDQIVEFHLCEVERFETLPSEQTEG